MHAPQNEQTAATVRGRLEEFGRRRYGSAAAGPRIVYCISSLVLGLLMMTIFWEGTFVSAPAGFVTSALAGLVGQELVGLIRRHSSR